MDALFWPPLAMHVHGVQTYMQAKHPYTRNKGLNRKKESNCGPAKRLDGLKALAAKLDDLSSNSDLLS